MSLLYVFNEILILYRTVTALIHWRPEKATELSDETENTIYHLAAEGGHDSTLQEIIKCERIKSERTQAERQKVKPIDKTQVTDSLYAGISVDQYL